MKKENQLWLSVCSILAFTILLYTSCHRDLDDIGHRRSRGALLDEARSFIKQNISAGAYAQLNWAASSYYYLKNDVAAMRIPLTGRNDTTDYIMVGTTGAGRWEGNYVHIEKENTGPLMREGSFTRTALDSSSNTVRWLGLKYRQNSRLSMMSAEPLTVPNTIWLGFVYAIQTQFPEVFNNWYYPATGDPAATGGGAPTPTLYFDPYIADNVIVDTSITNNFPCVKNIIDTLAKFGNLNQRAQVALHEIFNVGKKIKLTIKLDWSLQGSTMDGYTIADTIQTQLTATEPINFKATIHLNPDMLKTATKEYVAATLLHEATHCYIDFKWGQYKNGNIDSLAFATLFPIVYLRMVNNTFMIPTNLQQHNIMAENYFNMMASGIYAIQNDSMSIIMKDSIYKAITWGGHFATNAWRGLNIDTCKIKAINMVARDTTLQPPFILLGSGNCSDTFNFTYKTFKLQKQCD
jgi:hypothetical protein